MRWRRRGDLGGVEGAVGVAVLRVGPIVAVGPQPVDAEVRRRLAGVREAAPLLRVTEGPWPLESKYAQKTRCRSLDSPLFWEESGNPNFEICTRMDLQIVKSSSSI